MCSTQPFALLLSISILNVFIRSIFFFFILKSIAFYNERPTATATAAWRLKRLLCVASPLRGSQGHTLARRTAAHTPMHVQ